MTIEKKRFQGQFYTAGNPFACEAFSRWGERARLLNETVLEPFAGANSLINHLRELKMINDWKSYDIEPKADGVSIRDTIADFPQGFNVCITNPPWLAKNSATLRALPFPDTKFDDLYKLALTRCLENCAYVAALVPESFIRAGLHHGRLHTFVSLTTAMFTDTKHPVGLALFDPSAVEDVVIYSGNQFVGKLSELQKYRPPFYGNNEIQFNVPDGNLGLIAVDNTKGATIRFCDANELKDYKVIDTCRYFTKLSVPWKVNIQNCNDMVNSFRDATKDVFLTCYRGIRRDGMYRRRLDWNLARDFLCHAQ